MSFSFLFEMTWKSALIVGAALFLVALLRSRAASDRAAVLRLAVGLLLLLPLIASYLPALQVEVPGEPVQPVPIEAVMAASQVAPVEIAPLEPVPVTIWDDPSALIGILYLGGLLAIGFRIVSGLTTLARWTRAAEPVEDQAWLDALARSAGRMQPSLLVSDEATSPLSWGWLRPVILVDRDTLSRPEDADAIIAHEVAHIERNDWPVLILTRIAVAMFWFNPLVWLLEREVVQQAEEAADIFALAQVEPTHYAQTLVACASHSHGVPLPANSIAPLKGGLGRRITAILDGNGRGKPSGSFWTVAAMLGCTAFATPLAAVELVPAIVEAIDVAEGEPSILSAPAAPATLTAVAPLAPRAAVSLQAGEAPAAPIAPVAPVAPAPPPVDGEIEVPAVNVDVPGQVIEMPRYRFQMHGEKIDIPAQRIVVPRVKVNVPPVRIRIPSPPTLAFAMNAPGMSEADRRELERDLREAREEAAREGREAAAEAQAEARAAAAEARAEARADAEEARREVRREMVKVRQSLARANASMASGAAGMERGADQMVRGARQMDQEADRLRDANYRERQIAKAAAEGRRVTHQELIDAIPKLKAGSKKMLAGAEEMREGAARMRAQAMN